MTPSDNSDAALLIYHDWLLDNHNDEEANSVSDELSGPKTNDDTERGIPYIGYADGPGSAGHRVYYLRPIYVGYPDSVGIDLGVAVPPIRHVGVARRVRS